MVGNRLGICISTSWVGGSWGGLRADLDARCIAGITRPNRENRHDRRALTPPLPTPILDIEGRGKEIVAVGRYQRGVPCGMAYPGGDEDQIMGALDERLMVDLKDAMR